MPRKHRTSKDSALLAAALLVAVGGLIYELILGTAATYIFGDSITSFSLATGISLFGMGIGSWISYRFTSNPGNNFAKNEIVLAVIGGNSVLLLFAAFSFTPLAWLVFVLLSLAIGICIGIEIPLLIAMYKKYAGKSGARVVGKVLSLDYFGALIGSLLFPFVLLPYLGLSRTAYAVAILNLLVALYILKNIKTSQRLISLAVLSLIVLGGSFVYASRVEQVIDSRSYNDPVVYYDLSPYQKIVVTQYKKDTRLYLNNQLQFSSLDEHRYHETLAHSALSAIDQPKNVLILGGGDGLLAREVLRYPSVENIDIVDIDPAVTRLASTVPLITALNDNSIQNPKVHVYNQDAFQYVRNTDTTYDAVLSDLVDPSNERIAKLYSVEFYRKIPNILSPSGVFATQASSTFFTPDAFSTINTTLQTALPQYTTKPIGINVPSFGEWGFILASKNAIDFSTAQLPSGLAYLTTEELLHAENSAQIQAVVSRPAKPSTLLSPKVIYQYKKNMSQWSY